jgi:tetratricopeptide (TPR) repeat protein
MYQLRLYRRDLPGKFLGRIHEHFDPSAEVLAHRLGKAVRISAVRLQHWGYTSERLPEKMKRAAYLCEWELRERPVQLYYLVELAQARLRINDPRGMEALGQAAELMLKSRASPHPPGPMAASLLEQLMALPPGKVQPWASMDELMDLSRRWFPRSAPLVWAIARTHSIRGEWEQAERELRRLIHLVDTATHDHYMSFDPRVSEDARFNLGVALVRQAKLTEARAIFEALLASPRRAADARKNLDAIEQITATFEE